MNDEAKKVPGTGCESFTKPEEIAALVKYLKTDIENHESNIMLWKEREGIYGKAIMQEPESLSEYRENLSDPGISALSQFQDKISGINLADSLSEALETIKDDSDLQNLSSILETLNDEKEYSLSTEVEKIEDTGEVSLRDDVLKITDTSDVELGTTVETLTDTSDVELGTTVETLTDTSDVELGTTVETLTDTSDVELGTEVETLTDTSEVELGTTVETLTDTSDVELGTTVETLTDTSDVELGTTVETLTDTSEVELGTEVETLTDTSEVELGDFLDTIDDDTDIDLEDKVAKIEGDVDKVEELSSTAETILGQSKDSLLEEKIDQTLEESGNTIPGRSSQSYYYDEINRLVDSSGTAQSRYEKLQNLTGSTGSNLQSSQTKINASGDVVEETSLEEYRQKIEDDGSLVQTPPPNPGPSTSYQTLENTDSYSEIQNLDRTDEQTGASLDQLPENDLKTNSDGSRVEELGLETYQDLIETVKSRKNSDEYYKQVLHFFDHKDLKNSAWGSRIKSLISAYLSSDITREKYEEFDTQIQNVVSTSYIVQPTPSNTNSSNEPDSLSGSHVKRVNHVTESGISNILNNLSAEGAAITSVNKAAQALILNSKEATTYGTTDISKDSSTLRLAALDTALYYGVTYIYKWLHTHTLPGSSILSEYSTTSVSIDTTSTVSSALSIASSAVSAFLKKNISNPANVPDGPDDDSPAHEESWIDLNGRPTHNLGNILYRASSKISNTSAPVSQVYSTNPSVVHKASDGLYKFSDNYASTSNRALTLTLSELAQTDIGDIKSVQDLNDAIANSSVMSHPNKFTSTWRGYNTYSLEYNGCWEVVLEPFVGYENGYCSFLPGIHEINIWNKLKFNIETGYSRWIPITGFDLSRTRLQTKQVQLFGGEITVPSMLEFSNEFRITLVDDAWKSWRNYFERCVEASMYLSEAHTYDYYGLDEWGDYVGGEEDHITIIDKTHNNCTAFYKNVTFRCRLYSMTPQYETINKYDLLLVLRDFTEERSGDTDGSASDLQLSFSIVGECPDYSHAEENVMLNDVVVTSE